MLVYNNFSSGNLVRQHGQTSSGQLLMRLNAVEVSLGLGRPTGRPTSTTAGAAVVVRTSSSTAGPAPAGPSLKRGRHVGISSSTKRQKVSSSVVVVYPAVKQHPAVEPVGAAVVDRKLLCAVCKVVRAQLVYSAKSDKWMYKCGTCNKYWRRHVDIEKLKNQYLWNRWP